MLQNSAVFLNNILYIICNLAGFRNVWQKTPCTVCHCHPAYRICVVEQCCQI